MIENLNRLTKSELKRFGIFINSPYFNSYKTIVKLFEYLKPNYPYIKKEDISPENISQNVYSRKRANKPKIWKLISDFKKLFEKFLMQEYIEKGKLISDHQYLEYLHKKDMNEFYLESLKEANALLRKKKVKDNNFVPADSPACLKFFE